MQRGLDALLAQAAGHPVVILVQGNLTTQVDAIEGLLGVERSLGDFRALPPDAVLITFDWPSERVYRNFLRDVNEKCRRAFLAGEQLARFMQTFPADSHIALVGHSYGGRAIPAALHLLGGGVLESPHGDPPAQLAQCRTDLRVRAVVIEAASDHHWLDPGERFGDALRGCERFLNLTNHRDKYLAYYPLLTTGGRRRALGRVGLLPSDVVRLGTLASKYAEHDVADVVGRQHVLLEVLVDPKVARLVAPYLWQE